MTAGLRGMVPFVKWFYLLALSVWIGSIVFFSAVVAPTVFKTLDSDAAAKLQRAIFPRYYMLGLLCAMIGIVRLRRLLVP